MRDEDVPTLKQSPLFFSSKAVLLHLIGLLLNELSVELLDSKSKSELFPPLDLELACQTTSDTCSL